MLAGALKLQGCHSSRAVRAQLRPVSDVHLHLRTGIASLLALTNTPHQRPFCGVILNCHNAKHGLTNCSTLQAAYLGTTPQLSARSHKTEAQFLKPRKRPEFRLRTKEEKTNLLQALEESQEDHKPHAQAGAEHNSSDGSSQAQSWQSLGTGNEFVSPFFTDTGQSLESQQHLPPLTVLSRKEARTASLEHELHYLAHNDPNPTAIHSILKILIHDRAIEPNVQHYEALILANTWPDYGSVKNVEKILSEMENEDIDIGASTIAAVLKVLGVHPSPELSHRMLSMVERRWIQLTPQTQHHLLLAMVRTGQIELASWTLDSLRTKYMRTTNELEIVPNYLIVLLITELIKIGDWEGVLRYVYKLRSRRAADRDIPVQFWGWLLDKASIAAKKLAGREQSLPGSAITSADNNNASGRSQGTSANPLPRSSLPINVSKLSHTETANNSMVNPQLSTYHQNQASLSNPAKYLTEFLWSYYVTPMSIHPSWSTCYTVLSLAARSGTLWLAESAFTVMTYLDGIDETGNPKTKISDGVRALLAMAQEKAAFEEDEKIRREGKDPVAERQHERDAARRKVEKEEEYKAWWTELMAKFDEEEGEKQTKAEAEGDAASEQSTSTSKTIGKESAHDSISRSPKHESDPETAMARSFTDTDQSKHQLTDEVSSSAPFRLLDLSTAPPGNLWPLFPEIDSVGTGHVDPWDALGPKSSSNRRWTEAQTHFAQIRRQQRAEKKKG